MNKTKLLTFAVIALFVINIMTLSFLFLNKSPRPNERNKPRPRDIVVEKLKFDEQQIIAFDGLIEAHKFVIDSLDTEIKISKNNLFEQLSLNENKATIDSILNSLSNYKAEIEQTHFNHFLDIKKLCKPEQLDNYNELTKELSKIFAPNRMPKKDE